MRAIIISASVALIFIGGAVFFTQNNANIGQDVTAENVSIVDGKQIVEIRVRGGYQPRKSLAKSGLPTTIRFLTNGTFDCSAAVRIPSLKVSKLLPNSGSTEIDLGSPGATTLKGTCGMGMYNFEIVFL